MPEVNEDQTPDTEEQMFEAGKNPYCPCPLERFADRPIIGPGARSSDHEPGCCFGSTVVSGPPTQGPEADPYSEYYVHPVPTDVSRLDMGEVETMRQSYEARGDDETGLAILGTPEEQAAQRAQLPEAVARNRRRRSMAVAQGFFERRIGAGLSGAAHPDVVSGRINASISLPELVELLERVQRA